MAAHAAGSWRPKVALLKTIELGRSPTGVIHRVHVNDDELIAEEFTPTSVDNAILDHAKDIRNNGRVAHGAEARHAATVPLNIYMQWKKEWRTKYRQYFTWTTFEIMKINSSDYANLRTLVKRL